MNAAVEARQSELDHALDVASPNADLAEELFAVADLLATQVGLRNALADPTAADSRRRELAESLLTGRISAPAVAIAAQAAALKWGTGSRLVQALERQGLRSLLGAAQLSGRLDTVEDELFRLDRTVVANPALRQALDDRTAPVALRQKLLSDLLAGAAEPITLALAGRAVSSAGRSFEMTIEAYLRLAAAVRQRAVATVTVAVPLTDGHQKRLEAALVRQLGRQVNLQVVVDPTVLGGARVRVGDEVIEGTVAGRLAAAEKQLTQ